jgi:hypothetical protein
MNQHLARRMSYFSARDFSDSSAVVAAAVAVL